MTAVALSLFEDMADENPGLSRLTRQAWRGAYAEQLRQHPPVPSCHGSDAAAAAIRNRYADQDLTRLHSAVATHLLCDVQLVPAPADHQHDNLDALEDAYRQYLKDHPPFDKLAGDGDLAERRRRSAARNDIARFFDALDTLGATVRLAPFQKRETGR